MTLFTPFELSLADLDNSEQLNDLVLEHSLVLLRNHKIASREQLIEFAEKLGKLMAWDFGLVNELKVDVAAKNYLYSHEDVPFHWDGAFQQSPAILLFHCLKAPISGHGGETLFTNTTKLYEQASSEQQQFWHTLLINYQTEKVAHYGGSITQSMVASHPITRKPILRYAEPVMTRLNPVSVTIESMNPAAMQEFIVAMSQLIRNKTVCYAHQWQDGDVILADNHALIHGRKAIHTSSPRHIRRVQVAELFNQE